MTRYRVLVTPLSDRVLPSLMWSGPFTRRSDAIAKAAWWRKLGFCSARLEVMPTMERIA